MENVQCMVWRQSATVMSSGHLIPVQTTNVAQKPDSLTSKRTNANVLPPVKSVAAGMWSRKQHCLTR